MRSELVEFGSLYAERSRNGLTRPKRVRGSGVKMVNMGEIFSHDRLMNAPMDRVPLSDKERGFLLNPGDLLFARQSLVLSGAGKCGVFLGDSEPVTFESHIIRVRLNRERADPCFYYYYFKSPLGRAAIESIVEQGAGASGIRGSDLESLHVDWLPIDQQRAASGVLGALDDKIDENRRMNETLEAMSRTIFKDWFVDFGPTRAKAEGREPYLTEDIWSLFPEILDDEDKPEGWALSEIGREVEAVGGATPSTKEPGYWEGGEHCWATPKDLSKLDVPVLLDTDRHITDAGLRKISSGALPIGTVLLSSRAPIGYLAIADVPTAINQGFIAMKCRGRLSNLFVLHWTREHLDFIKSIAGGSTFSEISKKAFRPIPVIVPSESALAAFDNTVRPLFERVVANARESIKLAELRDLILPKLMSCEIRLKDAESAVEAVA